MRGKIISYWWSVAKHCSDDVAWQTLDWKWLPTNVISSNNVHLCSSVNTYCSFLLGRKELLQQQQHSDLLFSNRRIIINQKTRVMFFFQNNEDYFYRACLVSYISSNQVPWVQKQGVCLCEPYGEFGQHETKIISKSCPKERSIRLFIGNHPLMGERPNPRSVSGAVRYVYFFSRSAHLS